MRILSIFGTRPEAIKMAPVVRALRERQDVEALVCVSGQHRQMLDQVLEVFDIRPDVDLAVMDRAQGLSALTSTVITAIEPVLARIQPDRVLVHGDTTTTMAAALGAYYAQVPVGHVEAGLRTGDLYAPWPEEINRQVVGRIADRHFAPTSRAAANLEREGVEPGRIEVTGNTVIDALLWVEANLLANPRVDADLVERFAFLLPDRPMILLTGHRRENLDGGLHEVLGAVRRLSEDFGAQVVYPVHLNPTVRAAANDVLAGAEAVHLIEPVDYVSLVWLMKRARFVITDSGGIQEEAPSLGKPVLVTRRVTERPEAVDAGVARLVGTDAHRILEEAGRLLNDEVAYRAMAKSRNPYGDGGAAERIVAGVTRGMSSPGRQARRVNRDSRRATKRGSRPKSAQHPVPTQI